MAKGGVISSLIAYLLFAWSDNFHLTKKLNTGFIIISDQLLASDGKSSRIIYR